MPRLNTDSARAIINAYCIPPFRDFHSLNSQHVRNILDAADSVKYRAPKHASGSRARYFYAYLNRKLAPLRAEFESRKKGLLS